RRGAREGRGALVLRASGGRSVAPDSEGCETGSGANPKKRPLTRTWPVPSDTSMELPSPGGPGSFWEDRGDRRHCGIDIYAPAGTDVVAAEEGTVVCTGEATSDRILPY